MLKNLKAWTLIQFAALLNILAGVLVAHKLTPGEFGKFSTVVAGIMVMNSVLNPVINELSRLVAHYGFASKGLLGRITLGALSLCLGFAAVVLLSLRSESVFEVLMVLLVVIVVVPSSWIQGILTGKNRISDHGLVQTLGSLIRCLSLVFILSISKSLGGVLLSYALGFMTVLAAGGGKVAREIYSEEEKIRLNWTVVVGFFLLSLPFSLDQIFIQRIYQELSGEYAGVMTYAKTVMLGAAPILTIAFGGSLAQKASEKFFSIVVRASLVTVLIVAFIVGFLWVAGPFLFPILLGPQYVTLIPLLGLPLVAIGMHVTAYSIFQSLLLRPRIQILIALIIPIAIQAYLLLTFDSSSVEGLVGITLPVFGAQVVLAFVSLALFRGVEDR